MIAVGSLAVLFIMLIAVAFTAVGAALSKRDKIIITPPKAMPVEKRKKAITEKIMKAQKSFSFPLPINAREFGIYDLEALNSLKSEGVEFEEGFIFINSSKPLYQQIKDLEDYCFFLKTGRLRRFLARKKEKSIKKKQRFK